MKINTNKKSSSYTQSQQFAARALFILWLLASNIPEGVLADPKDHQLPVKASILGLLASANHIGSCHQLISPRRKVYDPCQPNISPTSSCCVVPDTLPEELKTLSKVECELWRSSMLSTVPTDDEQGELNLQVPPEEFPASCKKYQTWHKAKGLGTPTTIWSRLVDQLKAQMAWVWQGENLNLQVSPEELPASCKECQTWHKEKGLGTPTTIWSRLVDQLKAQMTWVWQGASIDESLKASEISPQKKAPILNDLGVARSALGDARQAVSFYKRALAMKEQVYQTPNHPEIANTFNNLRAAWNDLRDARQAVSYLERALAIYEQAYKKTPNDPNDLRIAAILKNLGDAWNTLGHARKAVSSLECSLAIYEHYNQKYNKYYINIFIILNNLGYISYALDDPHQAVSFYKRALAMKEQVYQTPNHSDIAWTSNNLGDALLKSGKAKEAVKSYQRALEIFGRLYNKNNPNRVMVFKNLKDALSVLEKAEPLTCPHVGLYEIFSASYSSEV